MSGSLFEPIIYAILGLTIGLVVFYKGLRHFLLKRMIENIPTSSIQSAAMGLVEVYGEVVPVNLLKAPLSGEKCVYFRLETDSDSDKLNIGHIMLKNLGFFRRNIEKCEQFYIKDATGKVLADCRGAKVDIEFRHRLSSDKLGAKYAETTEFLRKNGISCTGLFGGRKRLMEYLIRPGDKVYVLGTASNSTHAPHSSKHTDNMIIRKGENDRIFYLSDKSEKDIISRFGWKTVAEVFGGAFLVTACLAFLIFYSGLLVWMYT